MRILRLAISRFRGFLSLSFEPNGHVVIVGEPGAGRSDICDALRRVLDPDATRLPLLDDLDFHLRDRSQRIEVEIVLGHLSKDQEQRFVDHLELWDSTDNRLVETLKDPSAMDAERYSFVLRLCYRAAWDDTSEQAEHWVDYPKTSDPASGEFDRVRRNDREAIPFVLIAPESRPLSLGPRNQFRRVVDAQSGADFAPTIESLQMQMNALAATLTDSTQIATGLDLVLAPIRDLLRVGKAAAKDIIKFSTEGGSIAGLIRGLSPSLDRGQPLGSFPVDRYGSTVTRTLSIAQAMAVASSGEAIVVADDFGEGVDALSAQHLATTLRATAGQAWLSTRHAHVCNAFNIEELLRLTTFKSGRSAFQGRPPVERAERSAHKHLSLQLLPAMSARAVAVVEGPHDHVAITTVARRLNRERNRPLLAAMGVAVVDAGATPDSGGITAIPRLASLGRALGFFTVAIIDWDHKKEIAETALAENVKAADCVIRFPQGVAIELAMLEGIDDPTVIDALKVLQAAYRASLPPEVEQLTGDKLRKATVKVLKASPGFHGQFLDALPAGTTPPLIVRLLDALESATQERATGVVQL